MRRLIIPAIIACLALLSGAASPSHAAGPTTRPVLYGYLPTWRDKLANPVDTNFAAYTHIARAFLRPQPDGTFKTEDNYFDPAYEKAARAAGVKLLMAIGGAAPKIEPWGPLSSDPACTKTFLDSLAKLYDEHGYDGVAIDWEPTPQTDAGGQDYANLIKQLRQRFPNKLLVITISAKHYALKHLPIADILPNVDYVNAMFYDYNASWTGVASFSSNLNRDASPAAGAAFSVNDGLDIALNSYHIPPSKLVAGVTFWGYRFRANTLGEKFPKNTPNLFDSVEYGRVEDLLASGNYTAQRSESAGADYVVRNGGGSLITYETPASIHDKCLRAQSLSLAGMMVWHANADLTAGRTPLLSAIVEAYGSRPLPVSRAALAFDVARFRGKAVSPDESLASLQKADEQLRAKRAQEEDQRWMNLPATLKK